MTGLSQVDETKFKIKVVKEFGLDNLVHERASEGYLNDESSKKEQLHYNKSRDYHPYQDFHAQIVEAGEYRRNTLIFQYGDQSDIVLERQLGSIKAHIKTAAQNVPGLKYLQIVHEGQLESYEVIELLRTATELKMTNL